MAFKDLSIPSSESAELENLVYLNHTKVKIQAKRSENEISDIIAFQNQILREKKKEGERERRAGKILKGGRGGEKSTPLLDLSFSAR